MSLQKLTPYLSHTVWGGNKLKSLKNIKTKNDSPIGETWEVSSIENFSSKIGELDLSTLTQLSYLVKFIDTSKNLSVQVHPDNLYASQHESSYGKNESWLILSNEPDACIYLGFKEGITKKEFRLALESGLSIDTFLNKIKVKKGDFFYIPAGSVHAIGEGITLLEVQQSSGVTYRVWDWNRVGLDGKPRQLHIDKAFDVLNFSEKANKKLQTALKESVGHTRDIFSFKEFEDFEFTVLNYEIGREFELNLKAKESLIVLDGALESNSKSMNSYESYICLESSKHEFKVLESVTICLVREK